MVRWKCSYCKKIIVEDESKMQEDSSDFVECPYCRGLSKKPKKPEEKFP